MVSELRWPERPVVNELFENSCAIPGIVNAGTSADGLRLEFPPIEL